VVGALVDTVGELKLFQRTAQWIVPAPNPPIPDEDRARYRADVDALRSLRADLGTTFIEGFANAVVDADSPQLKRLEDVCRANLESSVTDPELRERLRPNYRAACKRLVVSPNFYRAIQQPNAHLVTEPIERVGPAGVYTTDGAVHDLDVIVLATGFRVDRFLRPMKVSGRDGVQLDDVWAERPSAYLSVSVPDFPNLFLVNGPNGPVGNFSLIDVAEIQLDYILDLVAKTSAGGRLEVSASCSAAERFERERVEAVQRTVWVTGCRSWYLDDRGIPAVWPWTMTRFREIMAAPDLSDYDIKS
jgi:cation diffusion facilitator CzcD-associated flavoprotein CzcO